MPSFDALLEPDFVEIRNAVDTGATSTAEATRLGIDWQRFLSRFSMRRESDVTRPELRQCRDSCRRWF